MTRTSSSRLAVVALMGLAIGLGALGSAVAAQAEGDHNPRVVPNHGPQYGQLGAQWWQWALSFPAADVPFFNTGGPVDLSAHQSGHIWFLAGANGGLTAPRTGTVPTGKSLFFPLANYLNDYPCPAEWGWEPDPGESMEHFLTRTGETAMPQLTDLFAEIDGVALDDLPDYRATSPLFTFTADASLASLFDPCITGSAQPGVTVGYWLLVPPLEPGQHTLHFGAPSWGQDITYQLTVAPGH